MNIIQLSEQCHGDLTMFGGEPLCYTFAIANLEKLAQAVIENYKAGLVNVGITYKASNGYIEGEFNDLVKAGQVLYALPKGETK